MEQGMISLTDSEERLRADAVAELQDDLRFEHLDERAADRAVWKFLCDAYVHRDEDHVGPFLQTYAREPVGTVCYFTLEHLMIKEPIRSALRRSSAGRPRGTGWSVRRVPATVRRHRRRTGHWDGIAGTDSVTDA
jgi:hypothetical protein